jgi:chemotaxis protein CheX
MLGCQLTVASSAEHSLEITSMVGLAGRLRGVLSVRCSREAGLIIAAKMLRVEPAKVGPEMSDALGEMANMVAGNFKNQIPGLADGCALSVPTVITGHDYNLQTSADSDSLELLFLFENMPVVILLVIHR